jgi:hypothetical protein
MRIAGGSPAGSRRATHALAHAAALGLACALTYYPTSFLCHAAVFAKNDRSVYFVGQWWQ